jgi:geranylgeranyl diphosphate synthase type II
MRYSIYAGGKRLRPILMLATGELFDHPYEDILPFAAAIEMIHTYSLIHDDLPAMDNDDFRRGKPTNHKVYGDSIAVLAGDGLLNLAFEQMFEHISVNVESRFVLAAGEIAHASGIHGMVGGQVVDIENQGHTVDEHTLDFMHINKTGALITAAVRAGAIISSAPSEELIRLTEYSKDLGLAFQIIDDILDVTGDESKLGKSIGNDSRNNKATYVSMHGLESARETARRLSDGAFDKISHFGKKGEFLGCLTQYLLSREY